MIYNPLRDSTNNDPLEPKARRVCNRSLRKRRKTRAAGHFPDANSGSFMKGEALRKRARTMRRSFLGLLLFLFVSSSLHAADKLRIGLPEFNSSTFSLPLGQMRGFFQEEGLQAEFIRIRSAVALAALVSGETDYHTVISPSVVAALRGIPVRVMACF